MLMLMLAMDNINTEGWSLRAERWVVWMSAPAFGPVPAYAKPEKGHLQNRTAFEQDRTDRTSFILIHPLHARHILLKFWISEGVYTVRPHDQAVDFSNARKNK